VVSDVVLEVQYNVRIDGSVLEDDTFLSRRLDLFRAIVLEDAPTTEGH
jgi:hypothetical protein